MLQHSCFRTSFAKFLKIFVGHLRMAASGQLNETCAKFARKRVKLSYSIQAKALPKKEKNNNNNNYTNNNNNNNNNTNNNNNNTNNNNNNNNNTNNNNNNNNKKKTQKIC